MTHPTEPARSALEADISTFETPHPTCPRCGHKLDHEEMMAADDDLYALAPKEGCAVVKCPACDVEYGVQGGYQPHYTSAFSLDDL